MSPLAAALPIPAPEPAASPAPELGGILSQAPPQAAAEPPRAIQRIRVGGNVQLANLSSKVNAQYPAIAREARIQDHVILHVLIGADGAVQDIKVVSGHPLLRQAALDAVKQWQYRPTMLNGIPVEVETEVDVNFTLGQF